MGEASVAAEVATLLVSSAGVGGDFPDLATRLERFRRDHSPRAEDARRLARNFAGAAARGARQPRSPLTSETTDCGRLLAFAFPDRIAKARGKPGEFLMANGRAATLEPHEALAREPFLAIGEISGRASAARIIVAAALSEADLETSRKTASRRSRTSASTASGWRSGARRRRRLGALVLERAELAGAARTGCGPRRSPKGLPVLGRIAQGSNGSPSASP